MKPLTSTELYAEVLIEMGHEDTAEGRESIKQVLVALATVAGNEIAEGMAFTIPGIVRVAPMYVPAKPRRKARNFQGEEVMAKAQPAKMRIKARPTGALKS